MRSILDKHKAKVEAICVDMYSFSTKTILSRSYTTLFYRQSINPDKIVCFRILYQHDYMFEVKHRKVSL